MIYCNSHVLFVVFSAILPTLKNTMRPIWSATSDPGSVLKKRKVMTLWEKSWVAWHMPYSEFSVKTFVKKVKEICKAIAAAMWGGAKTLHFLWNILLLLVKMQFSCVCRIAISHTCRLQCDSRNSEVIIWQFNAKGKWRN